MDCTENTAFSSSSIIASRCYGLDCAENTISNSSSIVVFFDCWGDYLAMAILKKAVT
jgi:hypothetical protein